MNENDIIIDLLWVMGDATKAGYWKVDGACDHDLAISRAEQHLRRNGYVQNSIDGSWMKDKNN